MFTIAEISLTPNLEFCTPTFWKIYIWLCSKTPTYCGWRLIYEGLDGVYWLENNGHFEYWLENNKQKNYWLENNEGLKYKE